MQKIFLIILFSIYTFQTNAQKILKDEVGNAYSGAFITTNFTGNGTCEYADGSKYQGNWKDSSFDGQGKYTWTNGSSYSGEWKEGNRNGIGIFIFEKGEKYEGSWINDEMNGEGTLYFENGEINYSGSWKNGKMNGNGKETTLEGEVYVGEFIGGKRSGKGELHASVNGEIYRYKGEFKKGEIIKGELHYPDRSVYYGDFKDGLRHGYGQFVSGKDGNKYSGNWIEGNKHGNGRVFLSADGKVYFDAQFVDGEFFLGTFFQRGETQFNKQFNDANVIYETINPSAPNMNERIRILEAMSDERFTTKKAIEMLNELDSMDLKQIDVIRSGSIYFRINVYNKLKYLDVKYIDLLTSAIDKLTKEYEVTGKLSLYNNYSFLKENALTMKAKYIELDPLLANPWCMYAYKREYAEVKLGDPIDKVIEITKKKYGKKRIQELSVKSYSYDLLDLRLKPNAVKMDYYPTDENHYEYNLDAGECYTTLNRTAFSKYISGFYVINGKIVGIEYNFKTHAKKDGVVIEAFKNTFGKPLGEDKQGMFWIYSGKYLTADHNGGLLILSLAENTDPTKNTIPNPERKLTVYDCKSLEELTGISLF